MMRSRFYFFTDASLLAPQTAAQAYGPAAPENGKDRFRVTDWHLRKAGSTDAVPAFAICDGLICAQADDHGTLSLILKPIEQPPFDFPFISYIIYKGIEPTSLFTVGSPGPGDVIDTSKSPTNDLIKSIEATWAANNNPGDPTAKCLGLHLNPIDYPVVADRARFGGSEPLDNLFYAGDPSFQLPLVRGGWRIADFSPTGFGLEVVVDRLGYLPRIDFARRLQRTIEVSSMVPFVPPTPNDSGYFMHWHAKEECLSYIDPCALWGCFFSRTLGVWNSTTEEFDAKTRGDLYRAVLFGGVVDTAQATGRFFNRRQVHLDIRDEHGHSLNYYKSYGNDIRLTLNKGARLDNETHDYYGSGWPYFTVSKLDAPSAQRAADVRFALPVGDNADPLLFLASGDAPTRGLRGRPHRFIQPRPNVATGFLEEASFSVPLYGDGSKAITVSGYAKLCYFNRGTRRHITSPLNPASLAPSREHPVDFLFRLRSDLLPGPAGPARCHFNDPLLVEVPVSNAGQAVALLAVPCYLNAANNTHVSFLPWFAYRRPREAAVTEQFPRTFAVGSDDLSALHTLAGRYGGEVRQRVIDLDGTPSNNVHVYFFATPPGRRLFNHFPLGSELLSRLPMLIVSAAALPQVLASLPTTQAVDGTTFVIVKGLDDTLLDAVQAPYVSPALNFAYLGDLGTGSITWESHPSSIEFYAHGNH